MPILAAAGQIVVPEPPVVIPNVTPVWREDAGTMVATWIDPIGRHWALSDTDEELGWFTSNGPAGWGATPIELVLDPLPRGGEQVRFIRAKPRRMQWPVYIGGRDHVEYTARRRALTRAFTMTTTRMAAGYIKVERPGGADTARKIGCYYELGLEGEAGQDHLYSRNVVQLYCPDGYWTDVEPVRLPPWTFAPTDAPFLNPFITIVPSKVLSGGPEGSVVVVPNAGDVEAWPVWTLTGPLTQFTAINYTVGSRFAVAYPLDAGQQLTITTNPATVRGPAGQNISKYVDWFNPEGTELWPLLDGDNEIRFRVDNAGIGASVQLEYARRYETA